MAQFVRQMTAPVLLLVVFLATEAAGLLCGRDCSNVCMNGSCDRFLRACKYGCKSGLNITGCPAPSPTTEKPGAQTGVIIGVAAGVAVLVIVIVIIVAVILVKRRSGGGKGGQGEGSGDKSTNPYENPAMRREDENPYDAPYMEAPNVPDLPDRPADMKPADDRDYETPAI